MSLVGDIHPKPIVYSERLPRLPRIFRIESFKEIDARVVRICFQYSNSSFLEDIHLIPMQPLVGQLYVVSLGQGIKELAVMIDVVPISLGDSSKLPLIPSIFRIDYFQRREERSSI